MDNIDITTVVFAIVAIFVIYKLRSVLGTRTGNEPRQMDAPPAKPSPAANVVNFNFARRGGAAQPPQPAPDRWKPFAEAGTPLAAGLDSIAAFEPQFDPGAFLAGARAAYEMIVIAFAEGDSTQLRRLLAPEVFANFDAAIQARAAAKQTMKTTLVALDKAEFAEVRVASGVASIAVRFSSQLISSTHDSSGHLIEGSETAVENHLDVWTFTRALGARDPNWLLSGTETVQ